MVERSLIVAEDLGLPTEKIERLSLEEAGSRSFSPLNLVVIAAKDPVKDAGQAGQKAFPFSGFRNQPLSTKPG